MSNIIYFKPKDDLACAENLKRFIAHCRDNLTLYDDQGGWDADKWYNIFKNKTVTICFSKYADKPNNYSFELLDEPFLSFVKAYVRYTQSMNMVSNMSPRLFALRALHDALLNVHGTADILRIDGLVIVETEQLIADRISSKDTLNKIGYQLNILLHFIKDKGFVTYLPEWSNPWRKQRSRAEQVDAESRKWQEERCPSQHQMLTIADCFANAETPEDKYWSSVLVFLMFAPGRVSELADLTIDCLHKGENGALGVRWYGAKGFGDHIKWVPKPLEAAVLEAHKRLVEAGKPARAAAKFAYENPGIFMRHEECVTPDDFPEDRPLNAFEFGRAMGFSEKTMEKMIGNAKNLNSKFAWNLLRLNTTKWIKSFEQGDAITYEKLADHVCDKYKTNSWPNLPSVDNRIWESLILIRDREFHGTFKPILFSWILPGTNKINSQISPRRGLKTQVKTLFQRMGYKDEDGSDISLTSHQLRVWLSTNAERQGMDAWLLAQWAGRSRVNDNYHYDLRTPKEREDNHRAILALKKRPTALEALKLNLPVSYQDLGLSRLGIADVTEYGMCVHDYSMSPCLKGGECMICREHVCIKGMPKTLNNIKHLEKLVESQFDKAKEASEDGTFGADRWVTHLGWKLAHIRTQRERIESEDTPEGAVLWIPPEHDPSPVKRALNHQNLDTSASADTLNVKGLLGIEDA